MCLLRVIVTSVTIEKEIQSLYKEGIALFNDGKFAAAEDKFEDMLAAQQIMYPPDHPEIVKTEKAILMVQRRRVTYKEQELNAPIR